MAAYKADPQVNPAITHFQAFFAALCAWRDLVDLIGMGAGSCHSEYPFVSLAGAR